MEKSLGKHMTHVKPFEKPRTSSLRLSCPPSFSFSSSTFVIVFSQFPFSFYLRDPTEPHDVTSGLMSTNSVPTVPS
jgi:hypothetical protein